MGKPGKNKLVRKEKVLKTALVIFAEKGYLKTTIADIASCSEVPEASIYESFANKEDILFRLAETYFQALLQNLTVHFLGIEGARNQFRKLIWHHLHYFEEHEEFCRVYMTELLYNPRYRLSDAYSSCRDYKEKFRQVLSQGVGEQEFSSMIDVDLVTKMVLGAMNHMMLSKIVLEKPRNFVEQAEEFCDLFFRAISVDSYPLKETIAGEKGKRKSILMAALREFTEYGFHQTTVSKIAKKAKVTEPTIYEHFNNKEELLYSIPKAAMEYGSLVESINSDLENMDTPVKRLRTFMMHQIRSVRDNPEYYFLLITELRGNLGFYASTHYAYLREYSFRFTDIINQGMEKGDFRSSAKIQLIRDLFFGLMDELSLELSIIGEQHRIIKESEDIFDLIFSAICVSNK